MPSSTYRKKYPDFIQVPVETERRDRYVALAQENGTSIAQVVRDLLDDGEAARATA
jgi:hypothetical protein